MKVSYFEDTDTLYIEFRDSGIAESKDLDENTILDVDANEQSAKGSSSLYDYLKHVILASPCQDRYA